MDNHVCPVQLAGLLNNWVRRLIQNPKKVINNYVKPAYIVADIGCGPGYFTIPLAKAVGKAGKVYAHDIQQQMIELMEKNAKRHRVKRVIVSRQCDSDSLNLADSIDFAMAFYMIHETPDTENILREVSNHLKTGGKFLVVEPRFHVNKKMFEDMIIKAEHVGLQVEEKSITLLNMRVLFTK